MIWCFKFPDLLHVSRKYRFISRYLLPEGPETSYRDQIYVHLRYELAAPCQTAEALSPGRCGRTAPPVCGSGRVDPPAQQPRTRVLGRAAAAALGRALEPPPGPAALGGGSRGGRGAGVSRALTLFVHFSA